MQSVFNSRNIKFKSLYGVISKNETIDFTVYIPRGIGTKNIKICIIDCDEKETSFSMDWIRIEKEFDIYKVSHKFNNIGIFWYYFKLDTFFGTKFISKGFLGEGYISDNIIAYQQTVIEEKYKNPSWFGEGITYNIFPDRFNRSKMPKKTGYKGERIIHENWNELPEYKPDEKGEILNIDFFGGDLKGIEEKLDYLKELGVTTIYLNPIFEACSNHRYNTGDYEKIDPMLGTEKDFVNLCKKAKSKKINIILDGVFSHTGFNSKYFNGRGLYNSVGAYQSKKSKYFKWYNFKNWNDEYSSWWGIYTLPQVNEMEPSFINYIIKNKNSILKKWLNLGASGYRLDVADELPDKFIEELTKACKETKEDALVLGEVWEDASNKISYGERRKYFLGKELDSVMNYPLRDATISFIKNGYAENFMETMENIRENYPKNVYYNLMNIIGTHDTPRILTVFGTEDYEWNESKDYKANHSINNKKLEYAKKLLKLAVTIQFTMPGSPCIYYGDEIGTQGFEDPFNRKTFDWDSKNTDILEFYKKLGTLRAENDILKKGDINYIYAKGDILIYERSLNDKSIKIGINRGNKTFNKFGIKLEPLQSIIIL